MAKVVAAFSAEVKVEGVTEVGRGEVGKVLGAEEGLAEVAAVLLREDMEAVEEADRVVGSGAEAGCRTMTFPAPRWAVAQ